MASARRARPATALACGALVALAAVLAACATPEEQIKEDRLAGHKDPYSFHRSSAYALLRLGRAERAVSNIRRMLASKPEAPEPHYLMGRAMLGMGMPEQAEPELRKAIELDQKCAPAYSLLGVLLDGKRQHERAEAAHRKAVKLQPKVASSLNNLGFCLYLQGRYDEAIAAYKQALSHKPAARRIHNNLGFAYARSGDLKAARKHFRLAGETAGAHNNLGLVHEAEGELEAAYASYVKAVAVDPDSRPARDNLARVCARLGRPVPEVVHLDNAASSRGGAPGEDAGKKNRPPAPESSDTKTGTPGRAVRGGKARSNKDSEKGASQ